MTALVDWADDSGAILKLYVSCYGFGCRMKNDDLEAWYARYGFRRLPRQPGDFRFMRRYPT